MKNRHKCICQKQDWDVVVLFIAISILAIGVSIWQDNPNFLWLLALIFGLSPTKCKAHLRNEE